MNPDGSVDNVYLTLCNNCLSSNMDKLAARKLAYIRHSIFPRFKLNGHERRWMEYKLTGKPLSAATTKWIDKRGGVGTERALKAMTEAQHPGLEIYMAEKIQRYESKPSHVYYASDGMGHVKIGCTRQLKARMVALLPGGAECLAVELGDTKLEHERHKQFAQHRMTGEWFRNVDDLKLWIRDLKSRAL